VGNGRVGKQRKLVKWKRKRNRTIEIGITQKTEKKDSKKIGNEKEKHMERERDERYEK